MKFYVKDMGSYGGSHGLSKWGKISHNSDSQGRIDQDPANRDKIINRSDQQRLA